MKNTFKLLTITVLGCVCIDSSDAMNKYPMTTEQVDQWKEQITEVLDSQISEVKTQIHQLQNDTSARNSNLTIPLLGWEIQLLHQEKQLIDSYNINNSQRMGFLLLELIYQIVQANTAFYNLSTNQVDEDSLSLANRAIQAKQSLQGIPAGHPIHQNFARFSELMVLYSQSNNEKEKAEILKEMEELKNQVKQMS